MQDGEDAYYITDLSLADLADALSRTSPPLLGVTARRDTPRESLQRMGRDDRCRSRGAGRPERPDRDLRHRPLAGRHTPARRQRDMAVGSGASADYGHAVNLTPS